MGEVCDKIWVIAVFVKIDRTLASTIRRSFVFCILPPLADFDCACLEGRDCRTKLLRADEKWEHAQFDEKEIRQEGTNKCDDHDHDDDDDKNHDYKGYDGHGHGGWACLKEQVRLDYAKNGPSLIKSNPGLSKMQPGKLWAC